MPTIELKLMFDDQLLEDGHTLSDYNIEDGATVTFNYGTGKVVVVQMLQFVYPPRYYPLQI